MFCGFILWIICLSKIITIPCPYARNLIALDIVLCMLHKNAKLDTIIIGISGGITMKKIGICIGVLGLIILIKVLLDAKDKKAASTNIIGGSDGQTTIYLAGKHSHKH